MPELAGHHIHAESEARAECAPGARLSETNEWLETDGLGGFAMGTATGIRTRRYHGLLIAATSPPSGRTMLLPDIEAWVHAATGAIPLSSHRYAPGVVHPQGSTLIESFTHQPWPTWVYRMPGGVRIEHGLLLRHGESTLCMWWRVIGRPADARLTVRPFISARGYHALLRERDLPAISETTHAGGATWRHHFGAALAAASSGRYDSDPLVFRDFLLAEEQARGFDCIEDLRSPGVFHFDLSSGEAFLLVGEPKRLEETAGDSRRLESMARRIIAVERDRRGALSSALHRAADAYIVNRGEGRTIIAGYPWFADWGRDTFVAMRGLCLATGRLEEARSILLQWASTVSMGMLPNRFADTAADQPEYNSVDASLWYVIAVHEFLEAAAAAGMALRASDRAALRDAVMAIIHGYAAGTRHGIRVDADGLLAAGEHGQQLTWMDARSRGREVTPRIGKPVEVNALWVNACMAAGRLDPSFADRFMLTKASFRERFWNTERGCLFDVVDVDHQRGVNDARLRPNQIFAVGGLPECLLPPAQARAVVEVVERELWTPLGLRSLARGEDGYIAHYRGGPDERDAAYHQGTVWPWLIGPFVEAWLRVHGGDAARREQARAAFLTPLLEHLTCAGLGHVSEIADAERDSHGLHRPDGCPFQAWSLGELIRVARLLDVHPPARRGESPFRTSCSEA
jgi:predicted glycogen debranching enzyme